MTTALLKPRTHLGRRVAVWFAARIIGPPPPPPSRIDPTRLRRILVIRTGERMGNLILMTPMLRALKHALPWVTLDSVVAPAYASLLENNRWVSTVHIFDKRRPFALWRTARMLRRLRYDVVIDAAHPETLSLTSAILARASHAPATIRHAAPSAERFFNVLVDRAPTAVHDIDVKLDLLTPLGLAASGHHMEVPRPADSAPSQAAPRLAVHLGARKSANTVPRDLLRTLVERARPALPPVFIAGPMERTADPDHPAGDIVRPANVAELTRVLSTCTHYLGADTGPTHLAVALDLATFAIFTWPGRARFGHDDGSRHRAVELRDESAAILDAFDDWIRANVATR
jgi:ADP-heptose:LPS heptosyltransferase